MSEIPHVLDGEHLISLWRAAGAETALNLPGSDMRLAVVEFRLVPPSQLLANPANWRIHPREQYDALREQMEWVGWVAPVVSRHGTDEILDGHLRCKIAEDRGDAFVPNFVVHCSDAEAAVLLASIDPLSSMAVMDAEKMSALLAALPDVHGELGSMLDGLLEQARALAAGDQPAGESQEQDYVTRYELVVECTDEASMEALFERLASEGYRCRTLIL